MHDILVTVAFFAAFIFVVALIGFAAIKAGAARTAQLIGVMLMIGMYGRLEHWF